jgi:hypothetical protein
VGRAVSGPRDLARAALSDDQRAIIELCVYESGADDYTPRRADGCCFQLTRKAAQTLLGDLAEALREQAEAYAARQQALL